MTHPIIISNHPPRLTTPNILNQPIKIRMITQRNQMLTLPNLPTWRMKLPTANTNTRTTYQTNTPPRIHMIKRNTGQILIQQLSAVFLGRKRQTPQPHPVRLTNLRNTKNPLRHNKRHTHISTMQNLHNLLQLTMIAENVNCTLPKPLLNHGNKKLPNIHLKRTLKRRTPIRRLNNKNITTLQRLSTVNPKVPSISHPAAIRVLNHHLSRTQNMIRLHKRNPLITMLNRLPIIQDLHPTVIKRQRTIHNPDKVSSSRGHQNKFATPQAPPQTTKMVSMRMSNHPQGSIRVKRVTSHRVAKQNRTPLTYLSLPRQALHPFNPSAP